MPVISSAIIHHIAMLSALTVDEATVALLAPQFAQTLAVIDRLREVDVSAVEPTYQVTGLENIWREDIVDTSRMFSQDQALANAPATSQGYIVVPQIIDQSE